MKSHRLIGRRAFVRAGIAIAAGANLPMLLATQAEARRSPTAHQAAPSSDQTHAANPLTAPYAAACAIEPSTGTVIFDHDMNRPWPTASLTKMMLMLIVARKIADGSLELTDKVTTSAGATRRG